MLENRGLRQIWRYPDEHRRTSAETRESVELSGKPDAWKLARPVWGWGRGETPRPTPPAAWWCAPWEAGKIDKKGRVDKIGGYGVGRGIRCHGPKMAGTARLRCDSITVCFGWRASL